MMTLAQVAEVTGKRLSNDDPSVQVRVVTRICTDSRHVRQGDLFIALTGEHFDGHAFVTQAAQQGAVAAVVSQDREDRAFDSLDPTFPRFRVADPQRTLGELARHWRGRFTLPLIAVTGSNGKTTVKEMIAAILASHVGPACRLATAANLNNDIGVPLTLFGLNRAHRYAVIECGMNHPGEISWLGEITQPTVALVNNAQREHQEFMATVEAVANENGQILQSLPVTGTAVFPADDAYASVWRNLAGRRRVLDFALTGTAAVTASDILDTPTGVRLRINTPSGRIAVHLQVIGKHNIHNALAACAACLAAGVPLGAIARGLQQFQAFKGRSERKRTVDGRLLIDDTYNANPDSVVAAIDLLADLQNTAVLVLGDMGEVGQQGPTFHAEIGHYARERGIAHLFALGEATQHSVAAFGEQGHHFATAAALIAALDAQACDVILVKGSRFMRMERITEALVEPLVESFDTRTGRVNLNAKPALVSSDVTSRYAE